MLSTSRPSVSKQSDDSGAGATHLQHLQSSALQPFAQGQRSRCNLQAEDVGELLEVELQLQAQLPTEQWLLQSLRVARQGTGHAWSFWAYQWLRVPGMGRIRLRPCEDPVHLGLQGISSLCTNMPDGILPGLQLLQVPHMDGRRLRLQDCTAAVLAASASTGSCVYGGTRALLLLHSLFSLHLGCCWRLLGQSACQASFPLQAP